MLDDDEVVDAVAGELHDVADALEGEELQITEPVEYTVAAPTADDGLPASVKLTFWDRDHGLERTIEVWS